MAKIVVIDSDAIFALYNPNDPLNSKATSSFKQLITQGFQIIYPASVIFEVVSLFQRVLPTPNVTQQIIDMIKNNDMLIHCIDGDILKRSASLFDPKGSKKNTLIDCSVVAIAKKIKADAVFAYDSFYRKCGVKPVEDIIKETL